MHQCSLDLDLDEMCKNELKQHYQLCESMCRIYGDTRSCYARFGPNTIGGHEASHQLFGSELLTFDHRQSFDAVTDSRLQFLRENFSEKPWLVCWSGGIDSTVIIASLLRNLTSTELSTITVFCNLDSIWLSPHFFTHCIKPYFKILDSTTFDVVGKLNRYLVIDGDLADYLWPSRYAYQMGIDSQNAWRTHQHRLIDFFATKLGDDVGANNFVTAVVENILQTPFDVTTNADWLWWVNYNFKYPDGIMRKYYRSSNLALSDVQAGYINWYRDQGYDSWALNHFRDLNHDLDIRQHKKPARHYIGRVTRDKCDTDTMVKIAAGFKEHMRYIKDCWVSIDQNTNYVGDARKVFHL